MGTKPPKQFANLAGRSVLEWSINPFVKHPKIEGIVIGLQQDDEYVEWVKSLSEKIVRISTGGASRAETVMNGLETLLKYTTATEEDWIIVHDASRPMLTINDLDYFITAIGNHECGGVMCQPIHDTVKSSKEGKIFGTVPREKLFLAQTPQMFRLGLLLESLQSCRAADFAVTDDSQAVERNGHIPMQVPGNSSNFKLTIPDDWSLADVLLKMRAGS